LSANERVDAAAAVAGAVGLMLAGEDGLPAEVLAPEAFLACKLLADAMRWRSDGEQARILAGIRALGRPDGGWADYDSS
jgi:hypothetical protein